ncbi:uncharacterized protein LOC142526187 [Primulina tabacum]|uniref:uncharacterized protein LOC142526187 n=1 Tax=Primulina tabacum TaxID=48773 RepID=UPI003F596769
MAPAHTPGSSLPSGHSVIEDPMSPYFLHHADNPGLMLVSQALTGENYISWSRAMKIALPVKNKLGFIDRSVVKPSDNESTLLNYWNRNNNIVISWILNSVSKEISASIIFAVSAAEIWQDLKERFQQSNGPRIFQLRREMVNLRQEQDPVSVYFTKLKTLWEELTNFRPMCHCGQCNCQGVKKIEAYFQTDYTMAFLMGLNDSLAQIRSQILLLDPLPPINRVFSLIVQEERQRTIGSQYAGNNSVGSMTFAVKSEQPMRPINNRGHTSSQREAFLYQV